MAVQAIVEIFQFYHPVNLRATERRLKSLTIKSWTRRNSGLNAPMWVTSAGTEPWAKNQVSIELVEEADVICVMEEAHRRHIRERFGEVHAEKVVVLDVPDNYVCWEANLITLLKGKLRTALALNSK